MTLRQISFETLFQRHFSVAIFQRRFNVETTSLCLLGSQIGFNPYNADIFLYKPWRPKGFVQFQIIINVLVSSFWRILIPMLRVHGHYKYFALSMRGLYLDVTI